MEEDSITGNITPEIFYHIFIFIYSNKLTRR